MKKTKTDKEKSQSEKFIEKAKEIGADTEESAESFERAFNKIVPPKKTNKVSHAMCKFS